MSRFKIGLFASAAIISTLPLASTANAQSDVQTEDLITVTGLRPAPLEEATSSITILTSNDLEIRNAPYLADQLRAAAGLSISRSGARAGLTQTRIRGAEGNHTLMLIDGIEVSDPVTGETDFGLWSGLDTARVEILRGEQSALYGSDAIGGVINVVTNRDPGFNIRAEGGTQGTGRLDARYGVGSEKDYLVAAISGFTTDGIDTSGLRGEKDGSQSYTAQLTGGLTLSDTWSMNTLLRYGNSKVDTDSDSDFDGLLNDTDNVSKSNQWLLAGKLNGEFAGIDHLVRASFNTVERRDFSANIFTDETNGERLKLTYSPSVVFGSENSGIRLSAIGDFEQENYERISTNTLFGDPNQKQSFETYGVAGEARIWVENFSLNASIRHDDNDERFKNATTWRVGSAYQFTFGTKLRASIGTGVKNPTFTELFGFLPANFIGNPDLKPEKSISYEFGLEQVLGPVTLSATYFDADLEDEIFTVFNPDFTSSPANRLQKSSRNGIEFSADWQVSKEVFIAGTFTDTNSDNELDEHEIRVPSRTASASIDWRSEQKPGLRAGFAADYVAETEDFFFTFPTQRVKLDSYVLVSATFAYPVTDRLSFTLRGENILDERVVDVFGFEQPGAGVFAGIKFF